MTRKEIDLDDIALTVPATQAMTTLAQNLVSQIAILMQKDPNLLIVPPDERVFLNDDGSLTVVMEIPGKVKGKPFVTAEINIPSEHWKWMKDLK